MPKAKVNRLANLDTRCHYSDANRVPTSTWCRPRCWGATAPAQEGTFVVSNFMNFVQRNPTRLPQRRWCAWLPPSLWRGKGGSGSV